MMFRIEITALTCSLLVSVVSCEGVGFLRSLFGHRKLDSSSGDDLDFCDTGCETNDDCEEWLICYIRKSGDALPTCCTEGNFVRDPSDYNYCVPVGCAAYTGDPDNPYVLENIVDDDWLVPNATRPDIGICGSDCDYNYECAGDLLCFQRDKEGILPACCNFTETRNPSSTDYCVPPSCIIPTPAPAPLTASSLCMSGETHVTVLDKGLVAMKDLKLGDLVLTADTKNPYQPIYAFAHIQNETKDLTTGHDDDATTVFLQIYTNQTTQAPLEVTPEHLVYLANQGPVRADSIQLGDILQGPNGTFLRATKIDHVNRSTFFNVLTAHGTILVDGIVVSTYIGVQNSPLAVQYIALPYIGSVPFLQQADLVHVWLSPLRLMCLSDAHVVPLFAKSLACNTHNLNGKLYYVDWGLRLGKFMEQQPLVSQLVGLMLVMVFLTVPMVVENVLGTRLGLVAAMALVLVATVTRLRRQWRIK